MQKKIDLFRKGLALATVAAVKCYLPERDHILDQRHAQGLISLKRISQFPTCFWAISEATLMKTEWAQSTRHPGNSIKAHLTLDLSHCLQINLWPSGQTSGVTSVGRELAIGARTVQYSTVQVQV